jgi:hypothetical protein
MGRVWHPKEKQKPGKLVFAAQLFDKKEFKNGFWENRVSIRPGVFRVFFGFTG